MADGIDYTKLRAIAEAATPGPWFLHDFSDPKIAPDPGARDVTVSCDHPATITVAEMGGGLYGHKGLEQARKDAAHIAAFDPPTVLALIEAAEQCDELLGYLEAMTQQRNDLNDACLRHDSERDTLQSGLTAALARVEALETVLKPLAELGKPYLIDVTVGGYERFTPIRFLRAAARVLITQPLARSNGEDLMEDGV